MTLARRARVEADIDARNQYEVYAGRQVSSEGRQHGDAGLVPGPSGHFGIPKEGEQVRAFVAKGKYNATGQNDNGFSLVYPNGIEKLTAK